MATYDPFAPWNTPGWTVQNGYPLVYVNTPNSDVVSDYPAALKIVTVTGDYRDQGGFPVEGIVRFRRTKQIVVGGTVLTPGELIGKVEAGALSVDLPASDDPDASEAYTYRVKECFPGGREYYISVPFDVDTADIRNLIVEDGEIPTVDLTKLKVYIGRDFDREFAYWLADGTPVPGLTGYTARFVVRQTLTGPLIIDVAPAFNDTTGVITLSLTDTETALLSSGTYLYGLVLVGPAPDHEIVPVIEEGTLVAALSVVP